MSLKKYLDKLPSLKGKTILVTGANSGVGFSLSQHILEKEGKLVMMCRNQERMNKAKETLLLKYPKGEIDTLIFDQSDIESINRACEVIKDSYPHFYALVFNAGMLPTNDDEGINGVPSSIWTNFVTLDYFSHQILTLFKDLPGNRRYVYQGSLASRLHQKKVQSFKDIKLKMFDQYNISKNGVESLFYNLQSEADEHSLFLLCEPGVVSTNLFNSNWFMKHIGRPAIKILSHSPSKAALCALRCLYDDSNNGDMFVPRGLFQIMGYPCKMTYKKKSYHPQYLNYSRDLWNK